MVYNTKIFIDKARAVHGNKYDYSKVEYVDSKTKVCIICPEHGEFWQVPASHLYGIGCRKCGSDAAKLKNKLKKDDFISKAKEVHGDKYDYSKVEYINSHTKVCIICPKHGEFWQTPNAHLCGNGCPVCRYEKTAVKMKAPVEEFIDKANIVHNGKYDYSKVKYVNSKTKVCIICPVHGAFWQTPSSHLQGSGCRKCANDKLSNERIMTTEEWVEKAKKVHGDRYDYSKVEYTGYYNKVTIICKKHGEFQQIAYDHLQGKGCPKCRRSKLEIEIENFLNEKNIEYIYGFRPHYLSEGKSHLSLDFYIPKYNAAIECQGVQHFIDGTFYDNPSNSNIKRDKIKYDKCKGNVRLFYFSNIKMDNYFDKVYNDKVELLKIIKDEKKLL